MGRWAVFLGGMYVRCDGKIRRLGLFPPFFFSFPKERKKGWMDGWISKENIHKERNISMAPTSPSTTSHTPNQTSPAQPSPAQHIQKPPPKNRRKNTYPVTTTTLPPSVNPLSVGVKRPTRPFSNGTARLVVDPPPSALVFPSSSLAGVWSLASGTDGEGEGCFKERRW